MAAIGPVLAIRVRRNNIGWLRLVAAVVLGLEIFEAEYGSLSQALGGLDPAHVVRTVASTGAA